MSNLSLSDVYFFQAVNTPKLVFGWLYPTAEVA